MRRSGNKLKGHVSFQRHGSHWLSLLLLFLLLFPSSVINPPCGHRVLLLCATLHSSLHDWNQVYKTATGRGTMLKHYKGVAFNNPIFPVLVGVGISSPSACCKIQLHGCLTDLHLTHPLLSVFVNEKKQPVQMHLSGSVRGGVKGRLVDKKMDLERRWKTAVVSNKVRGGKWVREGDMADIKTAKGEK